MGLDLVLSFSLTLCFASHPSHCTTHLPCCTHTCTATFPFTRLFTLLFPVLIHSPTILFPLPPHLSLEPAHVHVSAASLFSFSPLLSSLPLTLTLLYTHTHTCLMPRLRFAHTHTLSACYFCTPRLGFLVLELFLSPMFSPALPALSVSLTALLDLKKLMLLVLSSWHLSPRFLLLSNKLFLLWISSLVSSLSSPHKHLNLCSSLFVLACKVDTANGKLL